MRKISFFISMLAALVAFVLLIADGAASIEAGQIVWTSGEHFVSRIVSAHSMDRVQGYISSKTHVLIWRLLKALVLTPPALLVAATLSLIFYLPSRSREQIPPLMIRAET